MAAILIAASASAADVPFAFGGGSSDLTSYDSNHLESSTPSKEIAGFAPSSPQIDYEMIEVSLPEIESINKPSNDSNNSESQSTLSGFLLLNESFMSDSNNSFYIFPDATLPPNYASSTQTTASQWFEKGNKNYINNHYQDAIDCYNEAVKLNPQLKEVWCNKGIALCRLGKYKEAIDAIDRAIAISPDYTKAWRSKGDALKAMGNDNEARKAYQRAGQ